MSILHWGDRVWGKRNKEDSEGEEGGHSVCQLFFFLFFFNIEPSISLS